MLSLALENCFSIIIPTYNEAENIKVIIPLISKSIASITTCYEIIVVDDNSPDKTAEIARSYMDRYPVKVYVRYRERGLSSAIIYGARRSSYENIIVMDADLQHPPEKVRELALALKKGCDLAIASRYMVGGGVVGWSKFRLFESRVATVLAHILNPWSRVTSDPMSGFFACKKKYLLNPHIRARGYKVLLEVLSKNRDCIRTVCDIPYIFRTRVYGESKLGFKTIIDYIIQLVSNILRSK